MGKPVTNFQKVSVKPSRVMGTNLMVLIGLKFVLGSTRKKEEREKQITAEIALMP